jgi:hypothetical protein
MLQQEFRDPKFDPVTPEQSARLFHFEPGHAEVVDLTKAYADNIRKQAQSMLPKNAPAAPGKDNTPPKDTKESKGATKEAKDGTP